jgi:hypothetical protein
LKDFRNFNVFAETHTPLPQEDFIGNKTERPRFQVECDFVDFSLAHHHDSIAWMVGAMYDLPFAVRWPRRRSQAGKAAGESRADFCALQIDQLASTENTVSADCWCSHLDRISERI